MVTAVAPRTLDASAQRYLAIKQRKNDIKVRRMLSMLLNQIVLLEGKKGRGKSLATVAVAKQIRDYFGKPVVIVGTKVGLTPAFGEFSFLSEKDFVQELDKLSDITNDSKEGEVETAIGRALKTLGVNIMNSTIVFDEAVKLFDSRSPSDKLVKLFGYFVAQSRHYNITIVITIPNRDMLDKRIRRQIDWFGRCSTTCRTLEGKCVRPGCPHITTVRFVGGIDNFKFRVRSETYWPLYNSWAIVGFRPSATNITKY